jgi:hypothetical protein
MWHVASEEFNGPNSSSDVWLAYQVIEAHFFVNSWL